MGGETVTRQVRLTMHRKDVVNLDPHDSEVFESGTFKWQTRDRDRCDFSFVMTVPADMTEGFSAKARESFIAQKSLKRPQDFWLKINLGPARFRPGSVRVKKSDEDRRRASMENRLKAAQKRVEGLRALLALKPVSWPKDESDA